MTVISAQQPYYLPDFNFFLKIIQSDIFLIADHLRYRKQSKISRAYMGKNKKKTYLSIPIIHRPVVSQFINQVEICYTENWRRKHLRTLESKFRKMPYFEFYFPQIRQIIQSKHHRLMDLLFELIYKHLELLSLKNEIKNSSELDIVDSETLQTWIDTFEDPVLLIHTKEIEYYKKNFYKNKIMIKKAPKDTFLPRGYYAHLPILILLFLKGPESVTYLKM